MRLFPNWASADNDIPPLLGYDGVSLNILVQKHDFDANDEVNAPGPKGCFPWASCNYFRVFVTAWAKHGIEHVGSEIVTTEVSCSKAKDAAKNDLINRVSTEVEAAEADKSNKHVGWNCNQIGQEWVSLEPGELSRLSNTKESHYDHWWHQRVTWGISKFAWALLTFVLNSKGRLVELRSWLPD